MTDPAYAERMTQLFSVMLFMEYWLSFLALEFQMTNRRKGDEWFENQQMVHAQTDSIVTAWNQLIGEMEIDRAEMAKTGPPRHPFVTATSKIAQGEADPESVETDLQDMRDLLAVT